MVFEIYLLFWVWIGYLAIEHCLLWCYLFCCISFKLSWTANQIKILFASSEWILWRCQQLQPFGCQPRLLAPFATPLSSSSSSKNLQIEFAVSCHDGWLTQMTLSSLSQCRWQRESHCPKCARVPTVSQINFRGWVRFAATKCICNYETTSIRICICILQSSCTTGGTRTKVNYPGAPRWYIQLDGSKQIMQLSSETI